eukprot:2214540-Ditylum_brightwellii.AAC.1
MTHPFATPSLLPRLPHHLLRQYDAPDASLTWGGQCRLLQFFPRYRPPVLLVPFPGFGARRVASASDDGAVLPWWGWRWGDGVLLVPIKAQD